jgi:hypothetical protein
VVAFAGPTCRWFLIGLALLGAYLVVDALI